MQIFSNSFELNPVHFSPKSNNIILLRLQLLENLEEPQVTGLTEHRVPNSMNLTFPSVVTEEYLEFETAPFVTLLDAQV